VDRGFESRPLRQLNQSLVPSLDVLSGAFSNRPPRIDCVRVDGVDGRAAGVSDDPGNVEGHLTARPCQADEHDVGGNVFRIECIREDGLRCFDRFVDLRDGAPGLSQRVEMRLHVGALDGGLQVRGYPLEMVLAEKVATAIARGTANMRWRDFVDLYSLANRHGVSGVSCCGAKRAESALAVGQSNSRVRAHL